MKKEFDYAGNEIKEGDEVALIKIIDQQMFRMGLLMPGAGNKDYWEEERPDKPCFEVGKYHKVIVQEYTMNELGYVVEIGITGGGSATCYNTLEIMKAMDMDSTVILAIKGISDTKEYYDLWKKKKNAKEATGLME